MQSNSMQDTAEHAADTTRILLVEDEFLIRMLVADHLRASGFAVVEAFNGDEAIAILKSGARFDLVFTDVRMPGSTDGLALLGFIRAAHPDLPVLMTSGHLEPHLAYAGGAVRFLPKPCDLDIVVDELRAALGPAT